jgi:hypothetical protein
LGDPTQHHKATPEARRARLLAKVKKMPAAKVKRAVMRLLAAVRKEVIDNRVAS